MARARSREVFDADELSMNRVLAGEFAYAVHATRVRAEGERRARDDPDSDAEFGTPDLLDQVIGSVGRTLIPPQRSLNRIARTYVLMQESFSAPLNEYPGIAERLTLEDPGYQALKTGRYVFRVATLEGLRRAALLASELHMRAATSVEIDAIIRASPLVDPFTRLPFKQDVEAAGISFEGPRANGRHRVQTYLY